MLRKDSAQNSTQCNPVEVGSGGNFNWTVNSISRNSHHQDRLTYKLRNIHGTGYMGTEDTPSKHHTGSPMGTTDGGPAPYLNMRAKGVGSQQRTISGALPSFGASPHHQQYGFMGYSRHGSLGGGAGGVFGSRAILKGDNALGKQ